MTAEAEQRLLAVCRAVVVQAAADAWAAHEAATTAAEAAAAASSAPDGGSVAVRPGLRAHDLRPRPLASPAPRQLQRSVRLARTAKCRRRP